MQRSDFFTSACRHCRHYLPQGRRGGHCSQLDVPVQGRWKACAIAAPVFEPAWEFDGLPMWQQERLEVLQSPIPTILEEVNVAVVSNS
ncbi:MAG: hypothetical protein KME43_15225 [Myxacorys chilensis ATA2-1-KO14]|nr:hypothetical protein [Myxacorys chilensis ATA2-1-KO14]